MSEHEAGRRAGLEEVWATVLLEVEHPRPGQTPTHVAEEHDAIVHVITAWNPSSTLVDEIRNAEADDLLRAELVALDAVLHRCTGSNPDGSWREEGWAIVGLTRDDALAVGRRYGQDAIYEATKDGLLIVWCDSGRVVRVD